MANQDDTTDIKDEELNEEVETNDSLEDETSTDDESQEDVENTEDSEDEDSEDADGDETEDEDEVEFKKRFTQIKGDTPEEYIPNLEEAYRNSSTEAQRLAQTGKETQRRLDAVNAAVLRNPQLATALNEALGSDAAEVTVDPALLQARNQMEEQMNTDYGEFVDRFPEFESDPNLREQVLEELDTFAAAARKNGKILSMKEGLRKAWISLGKDYDLKEDVASAAKRTTAKSKTGSKGTKPKGKSQFTPEQIAYAKRMGLTQKQLEEAYKK